MPRCLLLIPLIPPLLGACGDPDSPPASLARPIVSGSLDPGHPAVGNVWLAGGGMCTGTLVGRRTVLTAAHCLTASSYSFELGSRTVAATKAIGHPDFVHLKATLPELPNAGNDWDMNDVAVLILASPVSEVTPIAPPTGSG